MPKIHKEGGFDYRNRMWDFRWAVGAPSDHPLVLARVRCPPDYINAIPSASLGVLPGYIDAMLKAQAERWLAKHIVWC